MFHSERGAWTPSLLTKSKSHALVVSDPLQQDSTTSLYQAKAAAVDYFSIIMPKAKRQDSAFSAEGPEMNAFGAQAHDQFEYDYDQDFTDANATPGRIDMNRIMARVDWNALFRRSNSQEPQDPFWNEDYDHPSRPSMAKVVAQATAGFTTDLLDALRCFAVGSDLYMASWFKYVRRASRMPPTPYDGWEEQDRMRNPDKDEPELPARWMHKAVAVQECYSGLLSRVMAAGFDFVFLLVTFMLAHMMFDYVRKQTQGSIMSTVFRDPAMEIMRASIAYGTYWFWYYLLTTWLVGKTFGMHVFGLEIVVDRRSDWGTQFPFEQGISFYRAFFRIMNLLLSPFLLIFTFLRRDGRMWHDLVTGTGVVYSWDAETALYRQDVKAEMRQKKMKPLKRGLMAPLLDPDSDEFAWP